MMSKKFEHTEAGQGGKLGHSNQAHLTYTEEIKRLCKKARRRIGKRIIRMALLGKDGE